MSTARSALARVFIVGVLVVTGCGTVSQPDSADWHEQARQTLDDVASEVATARLTLAQLDRGKLPSSYGVTLLADAEKAASAAEENLSSLQTPRRVGSRADRALALIGRAVDAVERTREVVVAGHYHAPALLAALDRLHKALDERRAAL